MKDLEESSGGGHEKAQHHGGRSRRYTAVGKTHITSNPSYGTMRTLNEDDDEPLDRV